MDVVQFQRQLSAIGPDIRQNIGSCDDAQVPFSPSAYVISAEVWEVGAVNKIHNKNLYPASYAHKKTYMKFAEENFLPKYKSYLKAGSIHKHALDESHATRSFPHSKKLLQLSPQIF